VGSELTILCISEGRDHAEPFLEVMDDLAKILGAPFVHLVDGRDVHSGGFLESVLDEAIDRCETQYVLRLDDDERPSPEMAAWLATGQYYASEHWAFRRQNLWPDAQHYIANPPLWPDLQTRLSVKEKAGSRPQIHQGSPFGTGQIAPVPIEHHKFLVRSREEREALVQRYDNVALGAGSDYVMFSVPERFEEVLKCKTV
jgi:hypothetical protein